MIMALTTVTSSYTGHDGLFCINVVTLAHICRNFPTVVTSTIRLLSHQETAGYSVFHEKPKLSKTYNNPTKV